MTSLAYPQELKPLTSLRFIAAFWVLLYHFKDHLGLGMGQFGLVADGYLGVDLFFTLSGFILAHVYLTSLEGGGFGYGGFLKNRIARVYPMHLAALGAMLVLFAGATAILGVGESNPDAFKWSDLPAHLFMVHAWGTTPKLSVGISRAGRSALNGWRISSSRSWLALR
jgi:peptidoglycan/LPS O-acetylase OafA/YrhL